MNTQTFTYDAHPDLPTDVITLKQAIEQTENDTLKEGLQYTFDNGYWLKNIQNGSYKLEKLEVEE